MEHPFLGASPDAMIQCVCCGQGVVEVKCPFCVSEMSFQEAEAGVSSFCLERLPGDKLQLRRDHAYTQFPMAPLFHLFFHCITNLLGTSPQKNTGS